MRQREARAFRAPPHEAEGGHAGKVGHFAQNTNVADYTRLGGYFQVSEGASSKKPPKIIVLRRKNGVYSIAARIGQARRMPRASGRRCETARAAAQNRRMRFGAGRMLSVFAVLFDAAAGASCMQYTLHRRAERVKRLRGRRRRRESPVRCWAGRSVWRCSVAFVAAKARLRLRENFAHGKDACILRKIFAFI